jgi:hypothetical protein
MDRVHTTCVLLLGITELVRLLRDNLVLVAQQSFSSFFLLAG